ncbi:MAG: hypothetical protein IPF81_15965 [Bacteroidetes bacterium]|nr:hypothetical protein [Bacteroidota bacterium]
MWSISSAPTQTFLRSCKKQPKQFAKVLDELKKLDTDVRKLEDMLEMNKAPYTGKDSGMENELISEILGF